MSPARLPAPPPATYWERRISAGDQLDVVGITALGPAYNRWAYRIRGDGFDRAVAPLVEHAPPEKVLDVGSGTGFYVDRWRRAGALRITGSDLTTTAVERLRATRPWARVVHLDIGADNAIDGAGLERESFDVISAMDVFFHILEHGRYRRAFANLAELLVPGGHIVFSEDMARRTRRRRIKVTRRAIVTRRAWRAAGLRKVSRAPLFVLMSPPSSGSRRARDRWARLQRTLAGRPGLAGAVAAGLFPLERTLVRSGRWAPSTEIVVCRKPATEDV